MIGENRKKINIGFLIYSLEGGGAERMVVRLANGMCNQGIDVSIAIFEDQKRAYEVDSRISVTVLNSSNRNKIGRTVTRLNKIHNFLKERNIDILFAFTVSMIPFAVLASFNTKCKVIGAERTNPSCLKKIYKICIPLFTPFCKGYVFQTAGAMKYYPKKCQKAGTVIGNIAPKPEMVNISKNIHTICSVGRLHTDKDFPTLIKAFRIVIESIPEAKLDIYGDGPQKEELENLSKKLGVIQNINFKGFTKQLNKELQKYGIFVFSSKAEGMPNALIEAMASGLACVSTDCEFGPSEIITNGVNGYLVKVGDANQMADKILYLLKNKELRMQMGMEASKISKEYSEEKILSLYIEYAFEINGKKLL